MTIRRLIAVTLLLNSLSVNAQETGGTNADLKSTFKDRLAVKVEYFGELFINTFRGFVDDL